MLVNQEVWIEVRDKRMPWPGGARTFSSRLVFLCLRGLLFEATGLRGMRHFAYEKA